jgi:hypothetical protein
MSAHDQAGGTIAPQSCKSGMVASAPYSSAHDDIRSNHGCYEGCVVVSRQLSGSDYGARTKRPTTQITKTRRTTVQNVMPAPRRDTIPKTTNDDDSIHDGCTKIPDDAQVTDDGSNSRTKCTDDGPIMIFFKGRSLSRV